jgi:cytidine deaminase
MGKMEAADPLVQALRVAARDAAARAYVPYSRFPVGAAVLAEDGTIYTGANVENASYGLTICAERNAIFQAVAQGQRRLRAVAVYTPTAQPTTPCGACRQVLNEFGPDAQIFSFTDGSEYLQTTLGELLPHAFGPHNLK